MSNTWKLENEVFYIYKDRQWCPLKAEDIYFSAFGGDAPENSILSLEIEPIKLSFPHIRFSKFAVTPELDLELDDGEISLSCYFEKKGEKHPIQLPTHDFVDYAFAGSTWCYFSGIYSQIAEVLSDAEISTGSLSIGQYVKLLNCLHRFPGIQFHDNVRGELNKCQSLEYLPQPLGLNATLYPYQTTGYRWLKFVTDEGCGCILGDEMGLGKTLQVIALFVERMAVKESPYLVVAPLSLLENWKREINRFAPELSVLIHHGNGRTGRYTDLLTYDVVITSYGATITDLSMFEMINWDLLVLDEAQNIKNPIASRTTSIKQIPHRAGIAVSGTPFENHMTDIWSVLDFAVPGCLGELREFKKTFADDLTGAEKIEPILTALMIRRKVSEVAQDLPEKVIIPQPLLMDDSEAKRYETVRQELLQSTDAKSATLASLTKLRMYCTHPLLLDSGMSVNSPRNCSTKYDRFCEIVEEIISHREKIIVFTSYSDMFDIIRTDITTTYGIPVDCINGSTPAEMRQDIVDQFSNRTGSAMLVLNPRAAGVGLNITAANHVIHYNLEWNPALEDQATARAFRRGQTNTVFVHRLFYVNTVEEIVNEKIAHKRIMADTAVVGSEGTEDNRALILRALGLTPFLEGNK